ncbi:MAG: hypothetical protein QOJ56_5064 [Mycobacterium sp.]|nr:hypothetical protein [Mycobacterium sp.]
MVTTASDIDSFIRTQREAAQVSVRQLAERPVLCQIDRGLHKPTADVLNQIAKASPESAGAIREAGIPEPTENQCGARRHHHRHDDHQAAEAGSTSTPGFANRTKLPATSRQLPKRPKSSQSISQPH